MAVGACAKPSHRAIAMKAPRLLVALWTVFLLTSLPESTLGVTIDWVTVGDPGNTADTTGYGAVAEAFRIGKYEVTIGQYVEFLNAVAAADPYWLYSDDMAWNLNTAGISRIGAQGSFTYSVINNGGNSANRPIIASWADAARFANWMHNGQLTGAAGLASTGTGAYTLAPTYNPDPVAVNPGAQFYIPTENQWYKAAYYKGGGTSAGYWDYATQSDSPPGNTIGNGVNQANYYAGDFAVTQSPSRSESQNYLTDVGAFTNSPSAYGTFDQSGNVWEWNDRTGAAGSPRGIRGGGWNGDAFFLSSYYRNTLGPHPVGFRLVSPVPVPEPSTWGMGLAGLAFAAWATRRRRAA